MITGKLHQNFCTCKDKLVQWYCEKKKILNYPIYSSYDIRDAGFKISNVDANIYPAGFNNICHVDRESASGLMDQYIHDHYGSEIKKIQLLTEEHTNNPYYWDNVGAIKEILETGGRQVLISIPQKLDQPLQIQSASGKTFTVYSGYQNSSAIHEFKPDLCISNNDFSNSHEEWASQFTIPVNPPRELGWYQRKKSTYFKHYNQLVEEFSQLVGIDPFILNVRTELFSDFELSDEEAQDKLAQAVDQMIANLQTEYSKRGIDQKPFVFVKNNAGTYGLAVVRVGSGAEIKEWNYKSRKKMKAAKGGREVSEVIIQEGIPSRVQSDGASAEPVIYMIGCDLAGGFLRTHTEKSSTDSLNSPGAVYKRLCVSDLNVSIEKAPLENVYGWSARLGLLAIGLEAQEMNVRYRDFRRTDCLVKG
ncbi:MAG: glutamate--cysteine ligase [Oligoflexia bacterium]|nr:MAG: glutamate--cysteine ligase [Oligoflexia bacterium]